MRSAVFLAAMLGQFLWGPLSDRWVRKYVIAIGAVLWSVITWLTAFVGSFPQLLVARAGMSSTEGAFNPSAWALVTDTFPKRRHGLVLGLMSLTYPVGTAAALIVVSLIGAENWRQPFIICGVIGMVLGSDATELRWSFGGAVLLMFSLGVVVCLALLRTVRRDMARQQARVRSHISQE